MRYNYTDAEIKKLLDSIVIITDTREQKNDHIINHLEKNKIPYKAMKLNYGDYSAMIPARPELGIMRDVYLDSDIVIERKASLDELAGNLTQDRTRFESELLRAKDTKFLLMIENANGYADIIGHKYRSQFDHKAFMGTLKVYEARFNIQINFIDKEWAGHYIFCTLFYYVREHLKAKVA
jgi:ERCC4-type nuclease